MDSRRRLLVAALAASFAPRIGAATRPKRVVMMASGAAVVALERGRATLLEYLAAEGLVQGRDFDLHIDNTDEASREFEKAADAVVASRPDVILVSGTNATRMFQARTTTIPIVFRAVGDPVAAGVVRSLARPGGNITGESNQSFVMEGKRLEVLRAILPKLRRVLVVGMEGPGFQLGRQHLRPAADQLAIQLEELELQRGHEESFFATFLARLTASRSEAALFHAFASERPDAVPFLETLVRRGIPALFLDNRVVHAGGLVSLGIRTDARDPALVRTLARVLRGENPATIPVIQSTRTHLAINLRTAAAMKLAIPQELLLRADEVID